MQKKKYEKVEFVIITANEEILTSIEGGFTFTEGVQQDFAWEKKPWEK